VHCAAGRSRETGRCTDLWGAITAIFGQNRIVGVAVGSARRVAKYLKFNGFV
jgi:hypothetical protein